MMIKRFSVLLLALASLAGVVGTGAGAQDLGPVATGVSETLSSKAGAGQIPKGTQYFPVGCDTDAEGGSIPSAGVTPSADITISCSGTNDDAHYSSNAGGAVFKTRITCTGNVNPQVFVQYQGRLQLAWAVCPGTSNLVWFERATSKYGQWVDVNGGAKTFYTPQPGSSGGRGAGWWAMSSTFCFVYSGVTSSVGSHHNYVCKTI